MSGQRRRGPMGGHGLECARQKKQKISKVQWENCSVI